MTRSPDSTCCWYSKAACSISPARSRTRRPRPRRRPVHPLDQLPGARLELQEVREWDILRIGPGVMRNLEAGSDGVTLIAFGAPLGETNDGEIVPGWWSDGG